MSRIAIIAPDKELADLCRSVIKNIKTEDDISIHVGPAYQGIEIAREEKKKSIDAIISRGGTFMLIENARLGIPVVDIGISYQNLIYSLWKAKGYGNKVALVGYKNVFQSIKEIKKHFEELTGMKIIAHKVNSDEEIRGVVDSIVNEEGRDGLVFVGGKKVTASAADYECASVSLKSTEEGIIRAIGEAQKIINAARSEKERANMFKAILDHISDGVISVDKSGKITVFNKAAQKIMTAEEQRVIGSTVANTIFSPHINKVVEKGKPALGILKEIGDTTVVTNSAPIFVDNEVSGAVATFQDVTYLQQLEQQVRRKLSRQGLVPKYQFKNIIGNTTSIKTSLQRAEKFAKTDYTIFITAETGSGKEMFAHSIHSASKRKSAPFVTINCASLPESLLEAELFGYTEGAFTGATKGGRAGLFEQAHGGTIFLDEIAEVSARLQILFLRVLQEKEVRRIGDNQIIHVDVRIIAASNRKLIELVKKGLFREDLFYRLNVLNLGIPPLRERREDIPHLINHFLSTYPASTQQNISITPEAIKMLQKYDWPGNVRQLENILQRIIVISENKSSIQVGDVQQALEGELSYLENVGDLRSHGSKAITDIYDSDEKGNKSAPINLNEYVRSIPDKSSKDGLLPEIENEAILQVLNSVKGNRKEAARILGISSTTLWRRLKKMDLGADIKGH